MTRKSRPVLWEMREIRAGYGASARCHQIAFAADRVRRAATGRCVRALPTTWCHRAPVFPRSANLWHALPPSWSRCPLPDPSPPSPQRLSCFTLSPIVEYIYILIAYPFLADTNSVSLGTPRLSHPSAKVQKLYKDFIWSTSNIYHHHYGITM
jgi:hypothetical protein